MKHLLAVVLIAFSLNGFAQQKPLEWHIDVNKAINISVETGKPLFFFFTGSDWCGWCIRLQKEVFFKSEFKKWANENVILVELDFPRRKKLDQKIKQQNQQLAQMFGVRGYPTVWFVTPELTEGKTNITVEDKYIINSKDIVLLRNEKKINSDKHTSVLDNNDNYSLQKNLDI